MKGFIFGLIVGAVGAVAGLHYTDQAHIDKIHDLAGIESEAEEAAPAEDADMGADEAAEEATDDAAMDADDGADMADDGAEEAADDGAEEAADDGAADE